MSLDPATLGVVSVAIRGDLAPLAEALQEARQAASGAGTEIAAALNTAEFSNGVKELTDAMRELSASMTAAGDAGGNAGHGVSNLTQSLDDLKESQKEATADLEAAKAVLDEANAQYNQGAISLETLTRAQQQYNSALEEANPEIKSAHEGMGGLSEAIQELAGGFLKIASIVAVVEGIRELATESIKAYAAEQQLTTSLTLMSGSAAIAEEAVAKLKEMSVTLAVPLGSLESTARRLSAVFGTGEGLMGVLQGAANVAAATGRDYESVAQALERVEITGQVAGRQLTALGLSWQDLASSMGTSIEEAQALLKKGGQSAQQDVEDVLKAINSKFGAAAQLQAQNLAGALTRLKNEAEIAMEDIGKALAPVVADVAKLAQTSIVPAIHDMTEAFAGLAPVISAVGKPALETLSLSLNTFAVISKTATSAIGLSGDIVKEVTPFIETFSGVWQGIPGPVRAAVDALSSVGKLIPVFGEFALAAGLLQKILPTVAGALNGLRTVALEPLEASLQRNRDAIGAAAQAMARQMTPAADDASIAMRKLIDAQTDANAKVEDARTALDRIRQQYRDGATDINTLNRAINNYDQAVKDATVHTKDWATSAAGIRQSIVDAQKALDAAKATFAAVNSQWQDGKASLDLLSAAAANVQAAAKALGETWHNTSLDAAQFTKEAQNQIDAVSQLTKNYQFLANSTPTPANQIALANAFKELSTATDKAGISVENIDGKLKYSVKDATGPAAAALQTVVDALNKLSGYIDNQVYVSINGKLVPTLLSATDAAKKAAAATNGWTDEIAKVPGAAGDAAHAIDVLKGSTDAANASTEDWGSTIIDNSGKMRDWGGLAEEVSHAIDDIGSSAAAAASEVQSLADELDAAMGGAASGRSSRGGGGGRGGGGTMGLEGILGMLGLGMMTGTVSSAQADAAAVAMGLIVVGNGQYMTRDALDALAPGTGWTGNRNTTPASHGSSSSSPISSPIADLSSAADLAKQSLIGTAAAAQSLTTAVSDVSTAAQPLSIAIGTIGDAISTASSTINEAALQTASAFMNVTQAVAATMTPVGPDMPAPLQYIGPASPESGWNPRYQSPAGAAAAAGITLNVQVSGNTIGSNQQATDLASMIADRTVTQLRTVAGLKM